MVASKGGNDTLVKWQRNVVSTSAETTLTLQNCELIHFGLIGNRLHRKELIHTMNRFNFTIRGNMKFHVS